MSPFPPQRRLHQPPSLPISNPLSHSPAPSTPSPPPLPPRARQALGNNTNLPTSDFPQKHLRNPRHIPKIPINLKRRMCNSRFAYNPPLPFTMFFAAFPRHQVDKNSATTVYACSPSRSRAQHATRHAIAHPVDSSPRAASDTPAAFASPGVPSTEISSPRKQPQTNAKHADACPPIQQSRSLIVT